MPNVKPVVFGMLRSAKRKSRRETIYKMKGKGSGFVACFVCGKHVDYKDATLEHKTPQSKGGTDAMDNLDISHAVCNRKRGNKA